MPIHGNTLRFFGLRIILASEQAQNVTLIDQTGIILPFIRES
jgi:hypothetical protein